MIQLGYEGVAAAANLSTLAATSLEKELKQLRKRYNDGKPFPPFKSKLPIGRPRKSK